MQFSLGMVNHLPRILYGIFTVAGWCAGTILNFLGPKITLCMGALGYP